MGLLARPWEKRHSYISGGNCPPTFMEGNLAISVLQMHVPFDTEDSLYTLLYLLSFELQGCVTCSISKSVKVFGGVKLDD